MDALPRRLAAFAFSLLTVSLTTVRADSPPLEIAAILSLSGPYAQVGTMEALAINTEIEVANKHGGVNGRALTLHLFDDESNTGRAYMLADRIVQAKQEYAVIGGSTTSSCDAIHLATGPNHVVQYCLSGGGAAGKTYFSSFAQPQRIFGDLPAAFFAEHRLKRVAMIVPENHVGKVYDNALQPALAAHGLELLSSTRASSADEATTATDLALRDRADVIYVGGDSEIEAATLHEVRKRHKKTTVWLVASANGSQAASDFASFLPRGPIYTAGDAIAVAQQLPASNPQRENLMSFWETFAHYNNGLAANTYSVIAADATRFVIAGLHNDGGVAGLPLAQAIESLPPTVGLYSTYRFSPEHHDGADISGTIVRLRKNATLEYVETLQPETLSELQPKAPAVSVQSSIPVETVKPPVKTAEPVMPVEAPQPVMPIETPEAITPVETAEPLTPVETAQPGNPIETAHPIMSTRTAAPAVPTPAATVMPVDTE